MEPRLESPSSVCFALAVRFVLKVAGTAEKCAGGERVKPVSGQSCHGDSEVQGGRRARSNNDDVREGRQGLESVARLAAHT